jgi:hypothetical protein
MEPISVRELLEATDGRLLGDFNDLDRTLTWWKPTAGPLRREACLSR